MEPPKEYINQPEDSSRNNDTDAGPREQKRIKSEMNLSYRRRKHYLQIIEDAGAVEGENGVKRIKWYEGDMWSGGFKYGIQKSKFKEVRDYKARPDETVNAAVVERTCKHGGPPSGELILVEKNRVVTRKEMFLNSFLPGIARVVNVMTGPIRFCESDTKTYHYVNTWSNGDCEWKESADLLEICPENGRAPQPTRLSGDSDIQTMELSGANKKAYNGMLLLYDFLEASFKKTGDDYTEKPVPFSNNTLIDVSVASINQHLREGNHDAVFASLATNYIRIMTDNKSLNVHAYPNGWSDETGKWTEDAIEEQIKEMTGKSLRRKLGCHSMARKLDFELTFMKLSGRLSGVIKELKYAGITNLAELPRMREMARDKSTMSIAPRQDANQYFCLQCKSRKTRREGDSCLVCCTSSRSCVQCHEKVRKKPGGLCVKCFIANGGDIKLCNLCNVNKAIVRGLCRRCDTKNQSNPLICVKCDKSMTRLTSSKGLRVCIGCCDDLCKKCGVENAWRGKQGERLCTKCSNSKCSVCGKHEGRFGVEGEKKCERCQNGPCTSCGIRVGRFGKAGSKICKRCRDGKVCVS
jgi:hypothetical protein